MNRDCPQILSGATYLEMISFLRQHGYYVDICDGNLGRIYNGKRIGNHLITHRSNIVGNLMFWVHCVQYNLEIEGDD